MPDKNDPPALKISRRRFLQGSAAAAAGAAIGGCLSTEYDHILQCATATPCAGAELSSIRHIVMFMQENRSFDQYFGMLPGVRGFGDPGGLFQQPIPTTGLPPPALTPIYPAVGYVLPMHTPMSEGGGCLIDIEHTWTVQHLAWSGGAMDGWLSAHQKIGNGTYNPWTTMSYYDATDLAFYYALADAFTICDAYHCSVMGPTDPNHLYWLSAWLDPDGANGGPLLATESSSCLNSSGDNPLKGAFTWKTMPEVLQENGVSWKFYGTSNFHPYGFTQYFAKFASPEDSSNPYYANGVLPTFEDFLSDAAAGTLPAVSWVVTDFEKSEHAAFSPQAGIQQVAKALTALTTIPEQWAATVLFLTYDENGGFFDHVAPPTAPLGTPGEYIGTNVTPQTCLPLPSDGTGAMPIGLGFRVPMLVISPYSRGGFVCSDVFDHTSMLRFIESRYAGQRVQVPNLTPWRRSITGDMTSALNLKKPDVNVPALPQTTALLCSTMQFPVPDPQVMPRPPDKDRPRLKD